MSEVGKVKIFAPQVTFHREMYILKTIENLFFCNKNLQLASYLSKYFLLVSVLLLFSLSCI